jgi:hypothetical protein
MWLAGWYATRLHYLTGSDPGPGPHSALCGAYVYAKPSTEWAEKKINAGLPHCKHCERRLAASAESPSEGSGE